MVPIKLAMVAGARPNFMKIAPLMKALDGDPGFAVTLIHTGQHYDDNMSGQFFRDLGITQPHFHLDVGSGTHAQQTAEIMRRIEPVLQEVRPTAVIVVGDVNSTAAAAMVAKKLGIDVVHAEAGLRSFDRTMPEEINRIVTDSITDIFLVTEESGRANLLREGIAAERIHLVGNLMIDSLRENLERARASDIADRLGMRGQRYGVVTLHRPANVDDPEALREILGALTTIAETLPLLWPVHPRTRTRLTQTSDNRDAVGHPDIGNPAMPSSVRLLEPLGYLDFLSLEAGSALVLTDSGGIQEETTVLGVPCLTLRDNTERPSTIELGTNRLAGTKKESILAAWREMQASPRKAQIPPLWDGQAGARSREVLRKYYLEPQALGTRHSAFGQTV